MMKLLKGIKIEKIGYGGIGLARMPDGKRILIKGGALPGSVVDLRIVKQRKDYVEAHITQIHKHDSALIDGKVFCPHFFWMDEELEAGSLKLEAKRKVGCGGCKRQMLSYPTQLKLKQDIVLDAFKKLASQQIEVLPIVGSPLEKGYRNKIEFSFGKYITKDQGNYPTLNPSPLHGEGSQLPMVYTVGNNKLPSGNFMIELARNLRKKQTKAESFLRELLRRKQVNGLKFRRQHPIGDYIADFYCPEKNLVIELDGGIHNTKDQKESDQQRDAIMKKHNINVIRFTNDDVFEKTEEVIQTIIDISNKPPLATQWRGAGGEVNNPNLTLSNRSVGFHKQGEFSKIVDIDSCGLISEKANAIFTRIKELCLNSGLPVYDQKTHQGFFRHLVIREGFHTDQILVNLSVSEDNLKQNKTDKRDTLLETFKKDELLKKDVTTFVITYNNGLADTIRNDQSVTKTFRGDGYIYEKLVFQKSDKSYNEAEDNEHKNPLESPDKSSEISFRISPFSFFQTNTLGAEQLFSLAMHMTGHIEGTILDLYCGTGSIGLSFLNTKKGEKLIGIEIVPEAIMDAQYNAKINGLENQVLFVAGQAEKLLTNNPDLNAKIKDIGLVIVDPPRDGLHKNVINFLSELKKEQDFKLLYISCNPITMVRDIELLLKYGFQIKKIQPVDMFPQTHHIECIGILN